MEVKLFYKFFYGNLQYSGQHMQGCNSSRVRAHCGLWSRALASQGLKPDDRRSEAILQRLLMKELYVAGASRCQLEGEAAILHF